MSTLEPLFAQVERSRATRERAAVRIAQAAANGEPSAPVHDLATFVDANDAYVTALTELRAGLDAILGSETGHTPG